MPSKRGMFLALLLLGTSTAINVYIENECPSEAVVLVAVFTPIVSQGNYADCNYFANIGTGRFGIPSAVCIKYPYIVPGRQKTLLDLGENLFFTCTPYLSAYLQQDPSVAWPGRTCQCPTTQFTLENVPCTTSAENSGDSGCYDWLLPGGIECLPALRDFTWTLNCSSLIPAPTLGSAPSTELLQPNYYPSEPSFSDGENTAVASDDGGGGTDAAIIAGATVGGAAAVGLAAAAIWFFVAARRKRKPHGSISTELPMMHSNYNPFAAAQTPGTTPSAPPTMPFGLVTEDSSTASKSLETVPGGNPLLDVLNGQQQHYGELSSDPLLQLIASNRALARNESTTSRGPLKEWELRFDDIHMDRVIGQGSYGRVYKADWNGTQVAVKVVLLETPEGDVAPLSALLLQSSGPVMDRLAQEASIMTNLQHPHVVQMFGITQNPASIVLEYCSRGSLNAVLKAGLGSVEKAAELSWGRRVGIAADCVLGMIYLHSKNVTHRDLKSPNLLITRFWVAKVNDFGLSRVIEDAYAATSSSMQILNPRWLAPEVLQGKPASPPSDVFAFGVIMWELLTWQLPWVQANPYGIITSITTGQRLPIPAPSELPGPSSGSWPGLSRYIELMQRCWEQQPQDRPSFQEVMAALREIDPQATAAHEK